MSKLIHIRRVAQITVLVILVLSPLSQIIRTYRQIPYPYSESPLVQNQVAKEFLDENDLRVKNKLETIYDDINGGSYSLDFYFLNFEEPYTAVSYTFRNMFRSEYWNKVQVIAVFLPLLLAFFFGRMFCAYVCPWSLIVSWNLKIQKKLFNRVPASTASIEQNIPKLKRVYFMVFTGIILLNPILLQYVLLPAIIQHSLSDYILFGSYALWGLLLMLFLSFELAQPAMICRNLCPTGLFLTLIGKLKLVTLDLDKRNKCLKGCDLCNEVCWLGLKPKTRPVDSACDLCARCLHKWPTNRLTIKRKHIATSLVVTSLLLFSCSTDKTAYDYKDYLSDVYLEENSIQQINEEDTLDILYCFVGNKVTQQEGGVISLNLHFYKNNNTFESPVHITCLKSDSLILNTKLENVNYPISIIKASVYRFEFVLERDQNHQFTIQSEDQSFQDFKIDFSYPIKRF